MDTDAHWHAYRLAGLLPRPETFSLDDEQVTPELRRLMDSFPAAMACVVNRRMDVLATNAVADAMLSPLANPRDMARTLFFDPAARDLFADWHTVARDTVAALRTAHGHERHDPRTTALIDGLLADSTEFAEFWRHQDVGRLGGKPKTFHHPQVGQVTLTYQTFELQDAPGRHLLVGTAEPASVDADRLAVLGSSRHRL